MSDRLTVVFDDPDLYRRLKVRAAEERSSIKRIVETAVKKYLGADESQRPPFTLEDFEAWMREVDEMDRLLPADVPTDLSDVKHHLYGWPKASERASQDEREQRQA